MNINSVLNFLHRLINAPDKDPNAACAIVHEHKLVTLRYIANDQWQISIDGLGQDADYHVDTVANSYEVDNWIVSVFAEMNETEEFEHC